MKSVNEAIVGQGTTIILIFVLIFYNYYHDTLFLFRNSTTYITNPFSTTKAADSNVRIHLTKEADVREWDGPVIKIAN